MNNDNKSDKTDKANQEKLRLAWMEALLQALVPQDQEERITRLLDKLESPKASPADSEQRSTNTSRTIRWKALAIAASILLAVFVVYQSSSSGSALAAVTRSLEAISQLLPHSYDLEIETTNSHSENETVRNEVFIRGLEQVALRNTAMGADVWLGRSSSDEYWIVPPTGPVLKGNMAAFFDWLDHRLGKLKLARAPNAEGTPFLHVATAMEIMSERCQLTKLPDETIVLNNRSEIVCEHIRGVPIGQYGPNPPESVDFWISRDLDIPIKVVVKWNAKPMHGATESFITKVTLVYRDQPELADDWFTAEGHFDGQRPIKILEPPTSKSASGSSE